MEWLLLVVAIAGVITGTILSAISFLANLAQIATYTQANPGAFNVSAAVRTILRRISLRIVLHSLIVAAIVVLAFHDFGPTIFPKSVQPGGVWLSPADSSQRVSTATFRVVVRAYSTDEGDPPIDHIQIKIFWAGLHYWQTACDILAPSYKDVYQCDLNLKQLGVPPGIVKISFDVYDLAGNISKSSGGYRTILYKLSSI